MKITLKAAFVFLFFSLLIIRPTPSYADWHGHGGGHGGGHWHGHGYGYVGINLDVWPGPYYDPYYYPYYPYYPYYGGPYYPGYAVISPSSYQPVVVDGATYYVNNGAYYVYTQYGYQAVATPVGATVPAVQTATVASTASTGTEDSFVINIPNNKGGYTAVVLKKSGNGFTGPQGEFYSEFPKVSQLQMMYGK